MRDTPGEQYERLVGAEALTFDPAQAALAARFDALAKALEALPPRRRRGLRRLLGRRRPAVPRGVYVHGDVGRGKTMLVDMFFAAVDIADKRRAHFNDFMSDVHERLHAYRQRLKQGARKGSDPVRPLARELAAEARLICLDELHVDDIADAMILGRLFTALLEEDVVLVATSNVPPDGLYAGGLNRALFLPLVALLKERLDVVRLDAATDYRLDKLRDGGTWFAPADRQAEAQMDGAWRRLTGVEAGAPAMLEVKGRSLRVPRAHMGIARFDFAELCRAELGPNDFLALARAYHTVLIDRIPALRRNQRNEARRFVLLVDVLYDNRVKLVASAAGEPEALYREGPLLAEFRRTASRLQEMRSEAYLGAAHRGHGAHDSKPLSLEPGCHSG